MLVALFLLPCTHNAAGGVDDGAEAVFVERRGNVIRAAALCAVLPGAAAMVLVAAWMMGL